MAASPAAEMARRAVRALEQRGPTHHASGFTCDLSPAELVAIEAAGCEPLQLVMGSAIWHIGFQMLPAWTQGGEITQLSQAMYGAREAAMRRMEREAGSAGADGIVGVHISIDFRRWGAGLAEFSTVGTAIRSRSRRGSLRTARGTVFTSDLSGQDFWTLLRTGYRPLGLVMGSCVYMAAPQSVGAWLTSRTRNQELTNLTEGMYKARELAMERMDMEARSFGADGIVGVKLTERAHAWGNRVIEFLALGTAVRRWDDEVDAAPPTMVLPLDR
ncbi:MAG TPA: heavy metal-binding domain-containing protein [Candidatus Dormibacteraeota bacterium]|jgi:uncharacterized protein YbjQ (UPF0145 family)|nr:heavy metal-binding domain-containing protein [Candidatus Dormibacteraeota bacterium]